MAKVTYQDKTDPPIGADWLNNIEELRFTVFNEAKTKAEARQALNVAEGAQVNPTGSQMVTAINGALGQTDWQSGGSGAPAWGTLSGTLSNQTDLQTALNGKAALSHSHAISDVTGLQTALDGKSATTHNHDSDYAALNILNSLISGDANNQLSAFPRFWSGSQAHYDAIATKDSNTFYFVDA